ncbi:MAG: DUF4364 family protein [Thermoplasmata archaeon]|nr:DUF4364 family protein [Candidatus Sysuiplasma jiujiangense]MBX8641815.1 DUF4364 family protein [Candidatus Sysuiplasma jiujiangense]
MPDGGYRTRARIFADILRAVAEENDAKPTHILYKANMSYERLLKYLSQLEENGFVEKKVDADRTAYNITDKGRHFLLEFKRVEEFTTAFGLKL